MFEFDLQKLPLGLTWCCWSSWNIVACRCCSNWWGWWCVTAHSCRRRWGLPIVAQIARSGISTDGVSIADALKSARVEEWRNKWTSQLESDAIPAAVVSIAITVMPLYRSLVRSILANAKNFSNDFYKLFSTYRAVSCRRTLRELNGCYYQNENDWYILKLHRVRSGTPENKLSQSCDSFKYFKSVLTKSAVGI